MGTYYQSDTAEAQTWDANITSAGQRALDTATATPATVTVSVPNDGVPNPRVSFIGPTNTPGTTDWSTSYAVQYEVTASTSLTYVIGLARLNSDGSVWRNYLLQLSGQTGTGLKSTSGAGTPNASGSRASTDRIAATVQATNSDMMAAQNLSLQVNTSDSYVTVPWTVGAPADPLPRFAHTALQAVHRASSW